MFGAVGIIIGPIIAGLFVTWWQIFQETFGEVQPIESLEDEQETYQRYSWLQFQLHI